MGLPEMEFNFLVRQSSDKKLVAAFCCLGDAAAYVAWKTAEPTAMPQHADATYTVWTCRHSFTETSVGKLHDQTTGRIGDQGLTGG
jgi:hypothetical protein